jgi:hypothetical protein
MSLLNEVRADWVYPGYKVKYHGRTYRVLDVGYRATRILIAFEPLEQHRSRVVIFSFHPADYLQLLES